MSVASAGFIATIQAGHVDPSKSDGVKTLLKPVRPYAKQHCKRHEGKTGVIKTPRRDRYEDLAKCL